MAHGLKQDKHNGHPSSERRYDLFTIMIDRKPEKVRRLFCSSCGQEGEIIDRTPDGLPPALIERRFKNKGWDVGKNDKHDLCPACVERIRNERRERRNGGKIKSFAAIENVFPLTPREAPPQPEERQDVQATAESPQEMSRADRRIIHAKLEEVYESEETGYRPGWSDAQVARDLGSHIPVGWVAEERERAFGPAKDNSEVRDMLGRVTDATTITRQLLEECKAHRAEAAKLVEHNNALMKRCAEIAKSLDGLIAIATRIEKAVR